jgi:hypothetical protein
MGPLLFALALQQPLEESIAAVPDSHLVAIHDDVTLVALPEKVATLFHELASRTALLGLRIAPTKCAVYSPSPTTPAEVAKTLALPHAPEGIVVASSPIGSRDFVEAFGRDKAAAVSRTVSKSMELPLELQNQHLLLRLCMVPRTTYLLRAGPIEGAGCMDDAVRDAALCIAKAGGDMVRPLFSPTAAEQIDLPLRLGGCGLPVPTSTLGAAARLSSAALTQAALQHAPALLRPFDGPHRGALQQMWHDVQTCAPGLWGPDLEPLPDPLSDHTLTQAQHTYARHRAQST